MLPKEAVLKRWSSPGLGVASAVRDPRGSGGALAEQSGSGNGRFCVMLLPHQINMKEGMSRGWGGGWKEPVPGSGHTRVQILVQLLLAQRELDLTSPGLGICEWSRRLWCADCS